MAKVTICDICGTQIGDGGFQTADGLKDICTECMEKLVAEYFSRGTILPEEKEEKFEEILESASAKEKLPSKKTVKMVSVDDITPRAEETRNGKKLDIGKMQALRDAGWTVHQIAEEMGCSSGTVYNNTHQPAPKPSRPLEPTHNAVKGMKNND